MRLRPQNNVDPISLGDLKDSLIVFKHVDLQGNVTGFDALMLVQYIISSGNFTNPLISWFASSMPRFYRNL